MGKLENHIILSDYFSAKPHFSDGELQKKPNIRKCFELPYQQIESQNKWDELQITLTDPKFISAKCLIKASALLDDYSQAFASDLIPLLCITRLSDFYRFFSGKWFIIEKYPSLLAQEAANWPSRNIFTIAKKMRSDQNDNKKAYLKLLYGPTSSGEMIIPFEPKGYPKKVEINNELRQVTIEIEEYTKESFIISKTYSADNGREINNTRKESSGCYRLSDSQIRFSIEKHFDSNDNANKYFIFDNKLGRRKELHLILPPVVVPSHDELWVWIFDLGRGYFWDIDSGKLESLPVKPTYGKSFFGEGIRCYAISVDRGKPCAALGYESGAILLHRPGQIPEFTTFQSHGRTVRGLSFDQNGLKLVSCSDDKSVLVWNVQTGKIINVLNGHKDRVTTASLSNEGDKVVSASTDDTIRIWDLNKHIINEINLLSDITDVAISKNGGRVIIGKNNGQVLLADIYGRIIKTIAGHKKRPTILRANSEFSIAVTASTDGELLIWDLEEKCLRKIITLDKEIIDVAISKDGLSVYILFKDNIEVINSADYTRSDVHFQPQEQYSYTEFLALSEYCDNILISILYGVHVLVKIETGEQIGIWDDSAYYSQNHILKVNKGELSLFVSLENGAPVSIIKKSFLNDDHKSRIQIAHNEGLCSIYAIDEKVYNSHLSPDLYYYNNQFNELQPIFCARDKKGPVSMLAISLSGNIGAIGFDRPIFDEDGIDNSIILIIDLIHDKIISEIRFKVPDLACSIRQLSFVSNDDQLLSLSEDRTLRLWNIWSGNQVSSFSGPLGPVTNIRCNDEIAAVGSEYGDISLYKISNGSHMKTLWLFNHANGRTSRIDYLWLSGKSERLASIRDGSVNVWNHPEGKIEQTYLFGGRLWRAGFDNQLRYFYRQDQKGDIYKWDLFNGNVVAQSKDDISEVTAYLVSPDGLTLYTGNQDSNIYAWDANALTIRKILKGHSGVVNCLDINKKGNWLISGSEDKTIIIWDLEKCSEYIRYYIGSPVRNCSVSTDGSRIVICDESNQMSILKVRKWIDGPSSRKVDSQV